MSANDYGEEFRPCPLCGGKANLRTVTKGHSENAMTREFMIVCDDCGLSTRRAKVSVSITPYGTAKTDFEELHSITTLWNGRYGAKMDGGEDDA